MQEEQSEELRDLQEELSRYNSLLDSKGWPDHHENGQGRVQKILNDICQVEPADLNLDKVISWIFQLGVISGVKRQIDFPLVRQKVLQAEVEELIKELDEEEGED